MRKVFLSYTVIYSLLLAGCEVKKQKLGTIKQESMPSTRAFPDYSTRYKPELVQKTNFDMLQGKWQHTEDTTNYLIFAGNQRKEIAAGMDAWEDEAFIISDKCQNDTDKESKLASEKDKYISVPGSDMCWYIAALDSANLSLSYVGRGNTLNYKKVG